jgi:asparagine synthase (glutamine-hydrolysing)
MSGFAGVVSGDGEPVDPELLRRMAGRLAFRGPDASVVRMLQGAGFCFTLMRTGPAPQAEEQPLNLDGREWLIGDIRLDGREDLRKSLSQTCQGIPAMATDEELALRTWQLYGEASGDVLMGDYAFAVWDAAAKRLVCMRDVIGGRILFHGQAGNRFCFSNTLDALRVIPGLDLRLDPVFIGDFLLQGWCSDAERTVHRGIRRLKPGHLLEFQNGVLASRRIADLPVREPLKYRRAGEYVEHFQSLLLSSVGACVPHDRVAFFLSGGMDSTSVAATASRGMSREGLVANSRAYTVDFRPIFDDEEAKFAQRAAEHLGVPIEIMQVGDERPFACWTDTSLRYPEPLHEPFQSSHVRMCRQVSSFARVALSGDGGDDILTGKAVPYARYLMKRGELLEIGRSLGGFLWRKKRLPVLGTGLRGRFRKWRKGEKSTAALPVWLRSEFAREMGLRHKLVELQRDSTSAHPFHGRGYASLSQGYWASVLEEDDAAWTGVALERRAPLLNRRLVEFLLRVPPVPWCMDKELLRVAMRGVLPEEVRTRPKTPLRQEPFAAQVARLSWSPLPLPPAQAIMDEFVNWKKLEATLRGAAGSQLWDELRPVSLHYWLKGLKGVENVQVIL